jgi:hypothetical protein
MADDDALTPIVDGLCETLYAALSVSGLGLVQRDLYGLPEAYSALQGYERSGLRSIVAMLLISEPMAEYLDLVMAEPLG